MVSILYGMQTEQRLIRLVADGHNDAFDELDRRHRDALTRYTRQLIHSDAEDITQQSLLRAYDAIVAGTDIRSFRNWTWRVATNLAITQLRKTVSVELPDVPMQQTVADTARTRETLQQLLHKIDQLPERQRAAVVLNSIEGKEVAEIAVLFEQQPNATSQLLHRARASLRVVMSILFPLWFIKWILPTTTAQAAGWTGAAVAGSSAGAIATGSGVPLLGGITGGVAAKLGIGVLVVAGAGGVATVQHSHRPSTPAIAHAAQPPAAHPPSTSKQSAPRPSKPLTNTSAQQAQPKPRARQRVTTHQSTANRQPREDTRQVSRHKENTKSLSESSFDDRPSKPSERQRTSSDSQSHHSDSRDRDESDRGRHSPDDTSTTDSNHGGRARPEPVATDNSGHGDDRGSDSDDRPRQREDIHHNESNDDTDDNSGSGKNNHQPDDQPKDGESDESGDNFDRLIK